MSTPIPSPPAPFPPPEEFGPPTPTSGTATPHHRRWPWVVGVAVVLLASLLVILGLVAMDATTLRHDLITAHFDVSADPFETGEVAQYTAALHDGGYQLAATTDPDNPAWSYAMFTRTAYNVTVEVTLVEVADVSADGAVGVACLDLPESNGHGYLFVVSADTLSLIRTDPSAENETLVEQATDGQWPLDGRRIGISCSPDGGDVTVTAFVDDAPVTTATDTDGFTRYQAAALVFFPFHRGDTITFDDVIARVPGA